MEEQSLKELKQIRKILAKVFGTNSLPFAEQFTSEVLDRVQNDFRNLRNMADQWIEESDLYDFLKVDCSIVKFIREEFSFTNYYKQGKNYFYNANDLKELLKQLKLRGVDICLYQKLKQDQLWFEKNIQAAGIGKKLSRGTKTFYIPDSLKDIKLTEFKETSISTIHDRLKSLTDQFFSEKLGRYITIFQNQNHASLNYGHDLKEYLPPNMKKVTEGWCHEYNYANTALKVIGEKQFVLDPIKDDDKLEL
jgi:hypothetical protein